MTFKQTQNIFSIPSNIMPPDEAHPESSSVSDECECLRNSRKPQQLVNVDSSNTRMENYANAVPSTKIKERRARAVKWGNARLYPISRLEEYSPERICQTWYQPSEYAEISRKNLEIIQQLMMYGACQEDETCTARGLEHMTDDEIRRRKRLRDEAVDAVLDEQDRQHVEEHRITPELDAIARVYAPIALRAYRIAQRMGLQDQQTANEIAAENLVSIRKPMPGSKAARKVKFSTTVKVHPGLHLCDYSLKQLHQCWYMNSDIKSFKSNSKKLIKSLIKAKLVFPTVEFNEPAWSDSSRSETSPPPNPIAVCIRGLEPYLCSSNIGTRKDNVLRTWTAVLDEQDRQDSINQCLPVHLAEASRGASGECVQMARKLAQQDEKFVAVYLAKELEELGVRIPHKKEESSPQRRGSPPFTSAPYRIHRDYRRDSLSVAGAASKTAEKEESSTSVPPSFIAVREGLSSTRSDTPDAVRSPHPLASGGVATIGSSILSSQLNGKIEREEIAFPPFNSETSNESNSSSESDFNMLKTMAKAINKQHVRKGRFQVLDRKD